MKAYTIPESALKLFTPEIQEQLKTLHQEPNQTDPNVQAVKERRFNALDLSQFKNIGELVSFMQRHNDGDTYSQESRDVFERFINQSQKQ